MNKSNLPLVEVSAWDFWLRYASFGGKADLFDLDAEAAGIPRLDEEQLAILDQAEWELANGLW